MKDLLLAQHWLPDETLKDATEIDTEMRQIDTEMTQIDTEMTQIDTEMTRRR